MNITSQIGSAGAARWIARAKRLAASIKGKTGVRREVLDGYLVTGKKVGGNRNASVLDLPGRFYMYGNTFGGGSSSAFRHRQAPERSFFSTHKESRLPPISDGDSDDGLRLISFGSPVIASPSLAAVSQAHEFDGGIILPSLMSSSPLPSPEGQYWAGIPESMSFWLVFHFVYGGVGGKLRSVSIHDAVIRIMAPGFDVVSRDTPPLYADQLRSSPFPRVCFLDNTLYCAVPVQRNELPDDESAHCIGGLLVFSINYPEEGGGASIGWYDVILPGELGVPALEDVSDEDGELANNISDADIAAIRMPSGLHRVVVTGRVRALAERLNINTDFGRGIITARAKAVYEGSLSVKSASYVDALYEKGVPFLAGIGANPDEIAMLGTGPSSLIATDAGVIEVLSLLICERPTTLNSASLLYGDEANRIVIITDSGETAHSPSSLGWRLAGEAYPGERYDGLWLTGTTVAINPRAKSTAGPDYGILGFVKNLEPDGTGTGGLAKVFTSGEIEIVYEAPSWGTLYASVYQREVTDDEGGVTVPFGALVTGYFNNADAVIGVMNGSSGNEHPYSVTLTECPDYPISGTFYLGNPLAAMKYGDMRID